MSDNLSITTLQIPLVWNTPQSNREYIEGFLERFLETDIVVFPETFTTGFAVKRFQPETMEGNTLQWMQALSNKFDVGIVGSLFIREAGQTFNRMIFTTPNAPIQFYDKWHLFGMGNECKLLNKGSRLPVFEYKNWKIKPLICYDLRFPVTSRNTTDYDVIVCIANWPKQRADAWDTLLKARAIENLCYVIGVNRVGKDENRLAYIGRSNIYDPIGQQLLPIAEVEDIQTTVIQKSKIRSTRNTFPFLNDRDHFEIH